jgi:hypothetical protein
MLRTNNADVNNTTMVATMTAAGKKRCQYDMMIRWPKNVVRYTSNPFTERGDRYEKQDIKKMLKYLIQYFIRKHEVEKWELAIIYDNSLPGDDNSRTIFKYSKGQIEINHLHNYEDMLADVSYHPQLIFEPATN